MKRKIKISEEYHFINVLDENIFQGCKVARLQNRGLFLVEDMRMKRERSAKRRMESAKCRPINDNLASENVVKKWTQRYRNWDQVLNQLIVLYGERLTAYL